MESCSTSRTETPGEEIVISGIAGRFPGSRNIDELKTNLMNKKDLISDSDLRWRMDNIEIPKQAGIVHGVENCDSLFFQMGYKECNAMDPMARMLLEHAYEAVIDAGINPNKLRGTNTAVIIGVCSSNSDSFLFYEDMQERGLNITGYVKSTLANKIAYFMGLYGPSYTVDTACSSTLYALDHAYNLIKSGECESAIVGGSNLCLHPYVTMQFVRLGVLSPDCRSKAFDEAANGYVRSEASCVIFLQKAKDAKRIYTTIINTKTNCDGYKPEGVTFPSSFAQKKLLEEFYQECGIPNTAVSFLEAHGTGTKVGDPQELNAIGEVLCAGRATPLKIGSIKSNLGHAEPVSGLCSVAKAIITMESGVIPPNINFKTPRKGVKVLEEGKVQVVTSPTSFDGGYIGINSFGFGGANAHVLLKPHNKEKMNDKSYNDNLPILVVVSGRTEEAVATLLSSAEKTPVDLDYIRLLHEVYAEEIHGFSYRGYMIIKGEEPAKSYPKRIVHCTKIKRPVCFVFTGIGTEWPGMGEAFMKFPIFAKAIQKCHAVLKPYGVDVMDIITNKSKEIFKNIINSFVGIAAMQIGMTDLLTAMGIVPDNIIGYSSGELGCAYADGCFTAEQMILSAYYRGLAITESKAFGGAMVVVYIDYEELREMCPPDIQIACKNAPKNYTISGPEESIKTFVAKLQSKNIFTKRIPCGGVAHHSPHVAVAGRNYLNYLRKVIPKPKLRSEKWLSTSMPHNQWSAKEAKMSSAEYHANSFLNAVLFEQSAEFIPAHAITIEIGPAGLLEEILGKFLYPNTLNVALAHLDRKNNLEYFLQVLGELYNVGVQFHVANIYPPISFPVSRGTPAISPHIRWDHSKDWLVMTFGVNAFNDSERKTYNISLEDERYQHIAGHVIDGRVLFPATGYIHIVWKALSRIEKAHHTSLSTVFENVKYERATHIPKQGSVSLTVLIQIGTGNFEVTDGDTTVVTGVVRSTRTPSEEMVSSELLPEIKDEEQLTTKDFYKELRLRGYEYSGVFRGIKSASVTGSKGHVSWLNNWISFMDSMLQIYLLNLDTRGLYVPTGIEKLVINTSLHLTMIRSIPSDSKELPVYTYKDYNTIRSGGIEMRGIYANPISRRKQIGKPVIEEYKFVAHQDKANVSLEHMVTLSSHLCSENIMTVNMKILELVEDEDNVGIEELLSPMFTKIFNDLPLIQVAVYLAMRPNRFDQALHSNVTIIEPKDIPTDGSIFMVSGYNLLQKEESRMNRLLATLKTYGFILTREDSFGNEIISRLQIYNLATVLEKKIGKQTLLLLKKRCTLDKKVKVVHIHNSNFEWLEELKNILKTEENARDTKELRLILVGENDPDSGILGFSNCLRREALGENVRTILIQDKHAPKFSLTDPLYAKQLELDLAFNVLRPGNVWGTYKHLPLPPPQPKFVQHAYVGQTVRGDLSSIRWLQGPITNYRRKEDLVYVTHSALNFRDIMLASGRLALEVITRDRRDMNCLLGFEYSGIDASGRRVMGLCKQRGITNLCVMDKYLTWEVPESFSLEDAATVPCTYATCYYALCLKGDMKKGDKVLIHAGTGGVGQAAINLALHAGCEVFTTVGTPEKREFIRKTFPSIPEDHIGNSRDTSFEQMILKQTNGRGVDIVLNSLTEEKLRASVRCLVRGGRFLEIGKFDLAANNEIDLLPFLKGISYYGIMLDNVMAGPVEMRKELSLHMIKALNSGAVKPITRTCFQKDEVEAAFRYMTAAKHIGKVIVKVHDEKEPLPSPILAYPQYHCLPNRSYVLIGGLGGLGLEVADWLIIRGAESLVFVSRNGIKSGYQRYRIKAWKSYGVNVLIISGKDASKYEDCELILQTAEKIAPVDGIFNFAAVLRDKLCVNQTVEDFMESVKPKAGITKRLDELSRKLCPKLQHFVIFSSVSCGRGTPGQTNYGLGNSVMERICEKRLKEGYPALAIQWGTVGEVGLVADMLEDNKELVIGGTLPQKIASCIEELDKFMVQDKPIVSSMVVAEKRGSSESATTVLEAIMNIMGITDLKNVSEHSSLAEIGMDSMMLVELKQTLERDFDIFLTAQNIRNLTIPKVTEMFCGKSDTKGRKDDTGPATDTQAEMKLLIQTSDTFVANLEICKELPVEKAEGRKQIFLIPGVVGTATILMFLASHLKQPATCLQMGNIILDTVGDFAEIFLPSVLERSKDRKDFIIASYSFGTMIAIELARRLEAKGFVGRLIFIDGSPKYLKTLLNQWFPPCSKQEFENKLLGILLDVFLPEFGAKLAIDLAEYKTWEEKLNIIVSYLPDAGAQHSHVKAAWTAIYKRFVSVMKYDSTKLPPIQAPITLITPSISFKENINADYALEQVTRGNVDVREIEGNHFTMMRNKKISAVINDICAKHFETFK